MFQGDFDYVPQKTQPSYNTEIPSYTTLEDNLKIIMANKNVKESLKTSIEKLADISINGVIGYNRILPMSTVPCDFQQNAEFICRCIMLHEACKSISAEEERSATEEDQRLKTIIVNACLAVFGLSFMYLLLKK